MESSEQPEATRRSVLRTSALGLGSALAGASLAAATSATAAVPAAAPAAAPAAVPAALPTPVGAAGRFLVLDSIPGESLAQGHPNAIDVIDASWSVTAATTFAKGGGASVGKPSPGALTVSIATTTATPVLLNRIAGGKVIKNGRLDVVKSGGGGGNGIEVLQLNLTNLYVTGLATHIGSGGDLVDTVTFAFGTISFSVWKQTTNGSQGQEVRTTWDVAKGTVS